MVVQFHVAHTYEIEGKHKLAKDLYQKLLQDPGITTSLRGEIQKQLGWMHQTIESLGEKSQRESYAIECLKQSIEADGSNGQNLYFLGRCYASLEKVHDAFIAYRNSVDKTEANADTWCSIG